MEYPYSVLSLAHSRQLRRIRVSYIRMFEVCSILLIFGALVYVIEDQRAVIQDQKNVIQDHKDWIQVLNLELMTYQLAADIRKEVPVEIKKVPDKGRRVLDSDSDSMDLMPNHWYECKTKVVNGQALIDEPCTEKPIDDKIDLSRYWQIKEERAN